MDLELKIPNPDLTALAGTDMNATFNYKTADFSVESAVSFATYTATPYLTDAVFHHVALSPVLRSS